MTNPETFNRVVAIGVDIQNDFCPGGALAVSNGDQVVHPFNQVAAWTREQGGHVAFTRDWHPAQTNHFADFGGIWPVHCVADTTGAELHSGLNLDERDVILDKGVGENEDAYSGFQAVSADGITLEALIKPVQANRVAVLIGGLATDYCVKATVLDACEAAEQVNYAHEGQEVRVFVVEDAIAAVNLEPRDGQRAIDEMKIRGARFIKSWDVLHNIIRVEA